MSGNDTRNNVKSRTSCESTSDGSSFDPTSQHDLVLDVQNILNRLPESSQQLCKQLMHDSPTEVARQIQIPRTTLHGHISMLRKNFRNAFENNRKKVSPHCRRSQ
jgi:hypothetical protein